MGLVLLSIFDLLSIRGRFLTYLVDGCFILAFLFLRSPLSRLDQPGIGSSIRKTAISIDP